MILLEVEEITPTAIRIINKDTKEKSVRRCCKNNSGGNFAIHYTRSYEREGLFATRGGVHMQSRDIQTA